MGKPSNHVVTNIKGGWSVKKEGSDKATRSFQRQDEAVSYAKELSKEEGTDVVIHGKDGRIRDISKYSRDPHPPKSEGSRRK